MKFLAVSLLLSSALAITGCSAGSGPGSIINAPPVQAANYSNASIVGTYSMNLYGANNPPRIGSFVADGNGNITSGAFSIYNGANPCTVSFTGTYALKADASGTASITEKPTGTNACPIGETHNFVIQAAQQGEALLVAELDSAIITTGTALKQ